MNKPSLFMEIFRILQREFHFSGDINPGGVGLHFTSKQTAGLKKPRCQIGDYNTMEDLIRILEWLKENELCNGMDMEKLKK